VEDLDGARIYYWYVDGVLKVQTTTETFNTTWTTPGTYELCVDASNDPCVQVTDPPGPLCTTITVHEANYGVVNFSNLLLCVGDTIYINSSGYTPGPYNTQGLFFQDSFGNFLDTIIGASGGFTSNVPGQFYVGAFNITSGNTGPAIGQNPNDWGCPDGCCALFGQAIHFQEIESTIRDILCNDNGTGNDTTDDVFTFNVLVTGLSPGAQWQSTDGTLIGVAGIPKQCGPYPIKAGTVSLDLFDTNLSTCHTSLSVDPPQACSSCPDTMDAGNGSVLNCKDTLATLTGSGTANGIYHWNGQIHFPPIP
jgi:hypothetical protein